MQTVILYPDILYIRYEDKIHILLDNEVAQKIHILYSISKKKLLNNSLHQNGSMAKERGRCSSLETGYSTQEIWNISVNMISKSSLRMTPVRIGQIVREK